MPRWTVVVAAFALAWIVTPSGPVTAQERVVELVGTIPGPATTVHVHDGVAYVSHGAEVRLYDLNDPSTPRPLGSYTFP